MVFIVGVLLAAFTPTYAVLLVARVIIGLAVGSASMTVPMYIGEVAPPRFRGGLVSLNQLAITSGILVSYLVDYGLAGVAGLAADVRAGHHPGACCCSRACCPRRRARPGWSPRTARTTRARCCPGCGTATRSTTSSSEHEGGGQPEGRVARELLSPRLRALLTLGVLLAVFQQITGINTVIYYAPTLLARRRASASSAALLANVVNGVVNVGMTIVAIWLLDRVGRRPLLISGTCGMAVGLTVLALVFLIGGGHLTGAAAYVAIVALFFYTGSFAIGLGPVFWLLISEIYPVRVRASAMSVATFANWAANFVVTVSFLTLLSAITNAGTFFLFAFLTLVAVAYFWRRVPETKGRRLEDITAQIEGRKVPGQAVR